MIKKLNVKSWLFLLVLLLGGVSSMWAQTTYKLEQVTAVEADGLYVFEQAGRVMGNTITNKALQTTTSYATTGLQGNEAYVWKLEKAGDNVFYLLNPSYSTTSGYLNNTSGTDVGFGTKTSKWSIAFTDGIALISNTSLNNRFLGFNANKDYKAYAESNLSSNTYPHDITVYRLVEEGSVVDPTDERTAVNLTDFGATETTLVKGTTTTTTVTNDQEGWTAAYKYSSDNTDVATVDEDGVITATAKGTATITVELDMDENDENYKAGETTTKTLVITVTNPSHTASFSVNGTIDESSNVNVEEGAAIEFPETPAGVDNKVFVGWTATAITGVTDEKPEFVTEPIMETQDTTFYAVFATAVGGGAATVVDELTNDLVGVTGTNYDSWEGIHSTSAAVYAGESAAGNNTIQLRSNNNNSGVVTTTSGGKVTKVTIDWGSTISGRTVNVYGSNTAYTAATDLYDSKKQGTLLGTIVCGTSTELIVDGDYTYVGIRSASGAIYLPKISITWECGVATTYSGYCTTVVADARDEAGISFAEDTVTTEFVDGFAGQALLNPNELSPITWSSTNENVATVEDGTVTVIAVGETWIKASFAGNDDYKRGEAEYKLIVQDSRQPIVLAFAEETLTVNVNEQKDAPELTGNTGNGAVSYESETVEVATVDPVTGKVTGVSDGTTRIIATVAATHDYLGSTAEFTVTVIDLNKKGTKNNPYEVSDITKTEDGIYVKGIISTITEVSTRYGNATYSISQDGSTTNEFVVFRGLYLNEERFTSQDQILLGDTVVVYGNVVTYNETLQLGQGNYIDSQKHEKGFALTIAEAENGEVHVYTAGGEQVESGTELRANTELTLSAVANEGYQFEAWTATAGTLGDESSANTTFTTAAEDATLSASFTKRSYTLTIDEMQNGSVNVTVDGEAWDGESQIPYASEVVVTAVPATDFAFGAWDTTLDDINTEANPLTFTMPADDVLIGASFIDATVSYYVLVDDDITGGSVEANVEQAKKGETVTLTPTTEEGYVFGFFTVTMSDGSGQEIVDTLTTNEFTMPANDVIVSAKFNKICTIIYSVAGEENLVSRVEGVALQLTEPESLNGMAFAGWSESEDVENPVWVSNETIVEDDMMLVAMFAAQSGEAAYRKATAISEGEYLIVYEDGGVALDGSLETIDKTENTISVTINDGEIAADATSEAAAFTITAVSEDGYAIQSNTRDYYIGHTGSKNTLNTSDEAYANSIEINDGEASITCGEYTLSFNASSGQERFRYFKNPQESIALYKKVASGAIYTLGLNETVKITDAKYRTFCGKQPLDFGAEGVTVYTVQYNTDKNYAMLTEVESGIAPAGVPVILFKDVESTVELTVAPSYSAVSTLDNNDLKVSDGTVQGGATIYALANKADYGIGFYQVASDVTIPEGKAYLEIAAGSEARSFIGFANDETTGIAVLRQMAEEGKVYNMQGLRVEVPGKGLYIVGGKKMVIK